jgi:hypothetical protein
MNDRFDGSVWLYSFSGVQPMVFTFYGAPPRSVADRLERRLNRLDYDPSVRRLVDTANVRYVVVGEGFVRPGMTRAPGLQHLTVVKGLKQVFRNDDATVYQVVSPVPTG